MIPTRPSIFEYAMRIAIAASYRSEDAFHKVGAVALDSQNRVVATGYNGLAPKKVVPFDWWNSREDVRQLTIHAEQNLCTRFNGGDAVLVAVTLEPCGTCALLLAAAGVKRVLWLEPYHNDAARVFEFHGVAYEQFSMSTT